MKKHFVLMVSIMLVVAGCESWRSDREASSEKRGASGNQSGIMKEPLGSQSQSSDPNQASSSRNVGQSGAITEQAPAKAKVVPGTNSTETPK